MKWRIAIIGWLIILSALMSVNSDHLTVPVKAETAPLLIENTTYYINDTMSVNSQDVIIRNSTVIINADLNVYSHNLTIEDSNIIYNPSRDRYRWIRVYGATDLETYTMIINSTFRSGTRYMYGGIFMTGHMQDITMINVHFSSMYEVILKEVRNAYINNYSDGHGITRGDYILVLGDHDVNDRGFYGHGLVENSNIYRLRSLVVVDSLTVKNCTIAYAYDMQGWGTTISMGNDYEYIFSNTKGQTKIYQWARIHTKGNETGLFIETPEGRIYVQNNSALWLHTWNAYAGTEMRSIDIYIGSNKTTVALPPTDYHKGVIDIYIQNTDNGIQAIIPENMTYQQTGNNTNGAVGITSEDVNYFMRAYKILLGTNILLIIGIGIIIYTVVLHRRLRR